jgi:hypothetical protein
MNAVEIREAAERVAAAAGDAQLEIGEPLWSGVEAAIVAAAERELRAALAARVDLGA